MHASLSVCVFVILDPYPDQKTPPLKPSRKKSGSFLHSLLYTLPYPDPPAIKAPLSESGMSEMQ